MTRTAVSLVAVLGVCSLAAQAPPGRPILDRGADVNDWMSYFNYGAAVVRNNGALADSAFAWASHLDPSRAEPLFGRWVAFWTQDLRRFQDFLGGRPKTLASPAVIKADSFYLRALQRNPFVPQHLMIVPYDMLRGYGQWRPDFSTEGWLAYSTGDYPRALERFGRWIARDPEKHVTAHFNRALAFVQVQRWDSASAEMQILLSTLRGRDTTGVVSSVYESKEMYEFGYGLLALVQGNNAAGRAAFERALLENLGFAPAHLSLGDLALAGRDGATAVKEYAQAVDLDPRDPWYHLRYGVALASVARSEDAVAQFRLAIGLEPYFADPYLALAGALETMGDSVGAARALDDFLARAPRRAGEQIQNAQRRLTLLRPRP